MKSEYPPLPGEREREEKERQRIEKKDQTGGARDEIKGEASLPVGSLGT